MSYAIYDPKNPDSLANLLTFDESHVDNSTEPKAKYEVGDTVAINVYNHKHNGKICVVIKENYGCYVVEPYNEPYFNDPRHLTKIGPLLHSDLVKVKKPKGASTVYVPVEKSNTLSPISQSELRDLERGGKKEKAEVEKLRGLFSGSSQVVTKVEPVAKTKKAEPKKVASGLKSKAKKVKK